MSSALLTSTPSVDRHMGRVKWFNNKAGYGFITVTRDGTETDIFVHHSDVMVVNEQYKYLVQGEYVEFIIISTELNLHLKLTLDHLVCLLNQPNHGSFLKRLKDLKEEEVEEVEDHLKDEDLVEENLNKLYVIQNSNHNIK